MVAMIFQPVVIEDFVYNVTVHFTITGAPFQGVLNNIEMLIFSVGIPTYPVMFPKGCKP
jgi:hypothetical protein